jgi:predicted P-loop ATPase/GTPase
VAIKSVQKSLKPRLIIKSIAEMSAAELQLIDVSWKNIMKRKPLEMVLIGHARNAAASLVDITRVTYVLLVRRMKLYLQDQSCWA